MLNNISNKLIIFLLLISPLFLFGQVNNTDKGAATIYTKGLPTGAVRIKYDSEWAIDINTSKIYRYDRTNSVWLLAGSMIGYLNSSSAPSGAPKYGAPDFVINNDKLLYWYNSSAWHCLNCASIGFTEGTGIDITGNVISNTAPDQIVVLNNGTGISVTGTYPNFTITNTSPDQTVTITGLGINSVIGSYPNFTIIGVEADGSVTNEIQQIDTFSLSGDTLRLSLSSDNVPNKQVILSGLSLKSGIYGPSDTVTYQHVATIDSGLTFRSYEDTSYFNILTGLNYGSFISVKPDSTLMRWFDVGGNNQILLNSSGITISTTNPDRLFIDGNDARYIDDYRNTYNDRSVTDKEYQDDTYLQSVDTFRLSNDTLFVSLIRDSVPESFVVLEGLLIDTSGYNQSLTVSGDTLYLTDGNGQLFVDLDSFNVNVYNSDGTIPAYTDRSVQLDTFSNIIFKYVNGQNTFIAFSGSDNTASDGYVSIKSPDNGINFSLNNDEVLISYDVTKKTRIKNQTGTSEAYFDSGKSYIYNYANDDYVSLQMDTVNRLIALYSLLDDSISVIGFNRGVGNGIYTAISGTFPSPGQILVAQADQTFHYADIDTVAPVQTLSLDSVTVGTSERFTLNISGGNDVSFDIPQGTVTSVAATQPAEGLTITGSPITSSGTFTFALANDLGALEGLSNLGLAVRTASDTWAIRSMVEAVGIDITNPSGLSGNIAIAADTVTTLATLNDLNISDRQVAFGIGSNAIRGSSTLTYGDNTMSFIPSTKDTILYVLGEGGNYFGLSTHVDTFNGAATAYKIGALNRNGRLYITSYETYLQGALRQVEGSGIESRGTSGSMFWHLNGDQYSGTTTGDNATHNRNLHWYFTSGGTFYGNPIVFQHNYSSNDSTGNTFEFLARNTAVGGITIPDSTLFRVGNWDRGAAVEIKHSLDVGFQTRTPTRDVDINGEVRIRDLTTTNPTLLVGSDADGVISGITLGTNLSFTGTTLNVGGSGGLNGIYGDGSAGSGDDRLPPGGSSIDVGLNNALIFDLDSNALLDNRVIYMQVETDDDVTYTRWLSMVAPTDSFRISSFDEGIYMEFEGVTGAGEGLVISSNTILDLRADSIKVTAGPVRSEAHYLTGLYNSTLSKLEGNTNGQILVWDETNGNWELGTATGLSYYQTLRDDGVDKTQRGKINFTAGSIISTTLSDDGANDETEVLLGIISNSISNTEIGTNAVNSDELADNGVADVDIRQSAGLSVIGRSANSTGNVADITAGTDNNVLRRSGTSIGWGAINLASSNAVTGLLPVSNLAAGAIVDGGNTTGATITIGTNDAQSLAFETNNTTFMTTNSSGNVGIGSSPGAMRLFVARTDTTTSGTPIGLQARVTYSPAASSSSSGRSLNMANQFDAVGQNFTGSPQAAWFENRVINAGNFTSNLYGVYSSGLLMGGDAATIGTVTNTAAYYAIPVTSFSNSIAGTVTKATGVLVANAAKGSLTMTNQIGVNVSALSAATNNTAILLGTNTSPSGNYAIYSTVTDSSIFSGPAQVYSLTASASFAATNTVTDRLLIQTNSNGAASAGLGGAIVFQGESSTNNNREMARIAAEWTTVTDASRRADLVFSVASSVAVNEYMRIKSGATQGITIGPTGVTTLYHNSGINTGIGYTIGNSSNSLTLGGSTGTVTISSSNTGTGAISLSSTSSSSALGISLGNSSYSSNTLAKTGVRIGDGYAPTAGTGTYTAFDFTGTFNQTGGASGIIRGIYLNPTLTAVSDFRGIDIAYSNSSAKGIYQSGSSTTNNFVGGTMFGSTSAPSSVAAIEISSTTKGLLLPRMTTTQRDAITAVQGLVIFNTTTSKMECYDGAAWQAAW